MSRVGKKPVPLPEKVKVLISEQTLAVEGPLGKLSIPLNPLVKVASDGKQITVTRVDDSRKARETHGMFRALIKNLVAGVSEGFQKKLDIEGIGYRAEVKGNVLSMTLGFSHPVEFPIPQGIKMAVEKQTRITVSGASRDLVGQVTANIRLTRPPEPYKGKGIRYEGEVVERKVGKAAASAGAGAGASGGK